MLVLPAGMVLADPDLPRKMSGLFPATYEAASAYLPEQCKKPGSLLEMCLIIPVHLPKDRKVYFMSSNGAIELTEGDLSYIQGLRKKTHSS